ncbi:hypothetical protein O1611_g4791 [Lasiodiplodia mahajangana]|uniref:Uncharacterized protein n=1 Tax=Lasiodiplodia mahajangana TaxID=1108764 RepID=A0ACC2JMU9_9PEZI|nr:hypothetical protein O1611_g4791 [Lasiodiplodia mahajangana]
MEFIQSGSLYRRLARDEEDQISPPLKDRSGHHSSKKFTYLAILVICFGLAATGGFIAGLLLNLSRDSQGKDIAREAIAPRIPVPQIEGKFVFSSAFSKEPPLGDESGDISEPIWDSLIPKQSITCAADSTVEPGEGDPNGFLGSGFARQCRDFEAVKTYVEKWRVFNATGFLAHGLYHGKAHVSIAAGAEACALSGLRELLSPQATVALRDSPDYAKLTERWREWHAPTIAAVVEVATEEDVQQTVRFAVKFNIPFVARAGGHGATDSLANAKNAIQIDFRKMNHVKLNGDGKTATLGGGVTVKQVVDGLEAVGKRAGKLAQVEGENSWSIINETSVTGICECVGLSAPILGGGHGWLQGQYGLAADQVVSARLVLPNGDLITVSDESYPDLFWAIRGAGHNFGLVTEWEYRVYDMKDHKWSYEVFIYSQDKLEALYELANSMIKDQPAEAIFWGYIVKVDEIDPERPILWFAVIYDGPTEMARAYAKAFHGIGPKVVNAGEGSLHDLAALTFQDEKGPGCAYGLTSLRYPIGLKEYNVDAVRKVYDHIDETFREVPEVAGSFFLIEGYSTQGVQAVDAKSTAFPHRDDKILVTSYIQYKPNSTIDPIAQQFGKKLQDILLEGSGDPEHLRAYVNYANGDESLQAVYGWEEWRLAKLRKLKQQWDPENRMKYYVPLV